MIDTTQLTAMMPQSTHLEERGGSGSGGSGLGELRRETNRRSDALTEDDGDDDDGGSGSGGGGGGGCDCGDGDEQDGPAEVFSPEHFVRGAGAGSVVRNLAWLDGNRK